MASANNVLCIGIPCGFEDGVVRADLARHASFPPPPPLRIAPHFRQDGTTTRSAPLDVPLPTTANSVFGGSRSRLGRDATEVSRFSCTVVSRRAGVSDHAEPTDRSRSIVIGYVAFLHRGGCRGMVFPFSRLNTPAHRTLIIRFDRSSTLSPPRHRARMDSLANLSCRALSSPTTCPFSPAHPRSGNRNYACSVSPRHGLVSRAPQRRRSSVEGGSTHVVVGKAW